MDGLADKRQIRVAEENQGNERKSNIFTAYIHKLRSWVSASGNFLLLLSF